MNKILALNKEGKLTYCTSSPENIGKGRCNHVDHIKDVSEERYNRILALGDDAFILKEGKLVFNTAKTNPAITMKHNMDSYIEARHLLETKGKVIVCQPTGTGKSSILSAILDDYKDKNVLLMAPNTGVIDQFNSYERNEGKGEFRCITYQKANELKNKDSFKEEFGDLKFDLVMLDEVHRIGAKEWSSTFNYITKRDKSKIIGVTATEIREDGTDVSYKFFGGNKVSNIDVNEAIREGILTAPNYKTFYDVQNGELNGTIQKHFSFGINTEIDVKKLDQTIRENSEKIRKEIKNDIEKTMDENSKSNKGVKILVFGSKISDFTKDENGYENRAMRYIDELKEQFPGKKINIFTYTSASTKAEIDFEERFRTSKTEKDTIDVMLTVKKYDEGIHIHDLDFIMIGKKTGSNIRCAQRNGRACDLGGNQTTIMDFDGDFVDSPIDYKGNSEFLVNNKNKKQSFYDFYTPIKSMVDDYVNEIEYKTDDKWRYGKLNGKYFSFKDCFEKAMLENDGEIVNRKVQIAMRAARTKIERIIEFNNNNDPLTDKDFEDALSTGMAFLY